MVNGTLKDVTKNTAANAVLTADIDLGGSEWTPIAPSATFNSSATSVDATTDKSYSGTFDGQGHTISNFTIRTNEAEKTSGLFGTVTGTIENLGIVNASFDNEGAYDGRFGAVCGLLVKDRFSTTLTATIQNCYVVNSSIQSAGRIAGAICGANYGGTIEDCYECGNTVTAHSRIGHLVGDNQNDYTSSTFLALKGTVTNCYSDTKLAGDASSSKKGTVTGGGVKNADQFASGEVAYLLQGSQTEQAWGQTLGTDDYPVLTTDEAMRVYLLTLIDGDSSTALYANSGNFTLPVPAEREGYTFAGWFTAEAGGTQVQNNATLTEDLTLYAQWQESTATGLYATEAGAWKAVGTEGMLRILGTEAEAAVYDLRGAVVYRGTARTIHVTAGAYIVRIGNEVQKAIVK